MAISSPKDERSGILKSITMPLGFYALVLLIIESFLGVAILSKASDSFLRLTCIWIGATLFLIDIIAVTIIVWFKPSNIVFDGNAHLRSKEMDPPQSHDDISDSIKPSTIKAEPKKEKP